MAHDLVVRDGRLAVPERWMARALGALYVGGGALALVWVVLPAPAGAGEGTVAAMASIAVAMGAVMVAGLSDRAPPLFFHVVVAVIQLVITVGFVAADDATGGLSSFYVWATTYAWLLFGRRPAAVQTIWTGCCLAVALLVLQPDAMIGLRVWLMVIGTVVAVGVLVGVVAGRWRTSQLTLRHTATHDGLTGLGNRAYFTAMVSAASHEHQPAPAAAVLLVDLDHFHLINDTYGQQCGDQILGVLAARLRAAAGPHVVLARMGADEFAVLSRGGDDDGDLASLIDRIKVVWAEPIPLAQGEVSLSGSVGVAATNGRAADVGSLLRGATVALEEAKSTLRGSVVFFDDVLRDRVERRAQVDVALRHALAADELSVVYQPIVDVDTGRSQSAEALLRWDAGPLGVIGPAEFVPLAEEAGLIVPIGDWVLAQVTAQVAAWRRAGVVGPGFAVAVNVSVRQLTADFPGRVVAALAEHDLPATAIVLEITESVLLDGSRRFALVLAELRSHRIRIVLDDFGTGYSSISYLLNLPLFGMKIDRSFVAGLPMSLPSVGLVTAIITMGGALDMDVVAEGVETVAQAEALVALGVRRAQGYLFAHPMPAAEFPEWCAGLPHAVH